MPVNELLDRHRSSVEAFHDVLKTIDDRVRRPSRIEPFETLSLNLLNKGWRRTLPSFDTAYLEIVDAGGRRHLVQGRDDPTRRANQDVRIVCFERPLDGGQEIRRQAGDDVAGNR